MRVSFLAVALAACGSGHSFDDAAVPIDAAPHQDALAACTSQLAGPSYPDLGALDGAAYQSDDHAGKVWFGQLPPPSTPPDALDIQLWAGYGVFSGSDIAPGTYTLTGAEAQYKTCGACVLVEGDIDDATGLGTQRYLAAGGTLTLSETSDGMVGSVQNLHLVHVEIGADGTSTQVDACAIDLVHATFEAYFPESACGDGMDNDHDHLTDCADSDCASDPHCLPESDCGNGIDDDSDGFTDCMDSDCAQDPHCLPETNCSNGIDDDTDGFTDCLDSDCYGDPACIVQPDAGMPDAAPPDANVTPPPDANPPPPPDAGATVG